MMTPADATHLREAIIEALPASTANHGETPEVSEVYVPPSHLKALRLDSNLVIGTRGVGKSFWATALRSEEVRGLLGQSVKELADTEVRSGFGVRPDPDRYPDSDTFSSLIEQGFEPYDVWRTVVARWLAPKAKGDIPIESWSQSVEWLTSNPEGFARLLRSGGDAFAASGTNGLIVFDALDRTAASWKRMDEIVRDLLRVVLLLETVGRLHGKVFLREDQYGRSVRAFPDASKLDATRVELTWATHDLHGLLWQYLCNAPTPHGRSARELYEGTVGKPPEERDERWVLHGEVRRDTATQRRLFEHLAGPWMGRDRRRGVPYVWSVSHLADGRGRTSPRSFLAAIRSAAEDSAERYPAHDYPLHYESIKRGVQKASEIRVAEMSEEYPWVPKTMEPLAGLNVPCAFELVLDRWSHVAPDPSSLVEARSLPPQHIDRGWSGVRSDLERLGVFDTKRDGRVDMPDLYRVGFGLGRKGGVRPVTLES